MAYNNNLWGDDWNHNYVNPFSEETEKGPTGRRKPQTRSRRPHTPHRSRKTPKRSMCPPAAAQSQRPTPQMRNQMMSPAYPQTQFLQRQTLPQTVPQFPQTAPGRRKAARLHDRKAGALLLAVCIVRIGRGGLFRRQNVGRHGGTRRLGNYRRAGPTRARRPPTPSWAERSRFLRSRRWPPTRWSRSRPRWCRRAASCSNTSPRAPAAA